MSCINNLNLITAKSMVIVAVTLTITFEYDHHVVIDISATIICRVLINVVSHEVHH